ncbi:MAG: HhoA/HhoB/HtrA family serine endopeptidase [Leptolyngbyaceae bacterium]|nr:HhoA/HhoB/HtrA family serine endopeptidase [Leptolyngbyaceae bacterium]
MSSIMVRVVAIALSLVALVTAPLMAEATPIPLLAQVPIVPHSFVADAVSKVGESVVRVDTERIVTRSINPSPFFNDPFFDDPFFRQFFGDRPQFSQPYEREERQQGQGSGVIIDPDGIVLTNAHVVADADTVTIRLKDGRTFDATVLGVDSLTDLAVVKVSTTAPLPVAALADSDQVQVGDWAIAVGNPLGLDNTVTLGIVSTLNRSSAMVGIPDKRLDFIQTDAAINPGNSGGPLLNASGEVIGINTAIRANANGIGFAIPINKAKEITPRLIQGEKVSHPYIGVQIANFTPDLARANNSDPNATMILPEVEGVIITGILPGTPAADSGLRRGDVITQVDSAIITEATELQELVDQTRVGQVLRLTVLRGDRTLSLDVSTAELQN